jgi:predicted transcriptional regulator
MGKVYKDNKVYACFALNRLAAELDIDLYQQDLEAKLDLLFSRPVPGVSKEAIKHEIRSNHYMTEKVIGSLVDDGLAEVLRNETRYTVRITKKGVLHLRRFNELYIEIYDEFIRDHYRFSGMPGWLNVERRT